MNLAAVNNSLAYSFSRAATTYDTAAGVQSYVAEQLGAEFASMIRNLPAGPILEIGCGTGLMTKHLLRAAGDRPLVVTDISEAMLQQCRKNLAEQCALPEHVKFSVLDAETLSEANTYAAVVCAFSLQWFNNADATIDRMLASLVKGGRLFLSVPTNGSFPEWKEICRSVGSGFTGNLLPDCRWLQSAAKQRSSKHNFKIEHVRSFYGSAQAFFQGLRKTGADFRLKEEDSTVNLLAVTREWDRRGRVGVVSTYEVCYGWMMAPDSEVASDLS